MDLPHALLLRNLTTGSEKTVLRYPRHAAALWSPGGNYLAIADYGESDGSACWILRPGDGSMIDAGEAIARTPAGRALLANHHLYYDLGRWKSESTLEILAWGYGAPGRREARGDFLYNMGKGTVKKRRSPAGSSN